MTADDPQAAEHERWIRQQVKVSQHDPSNGEAAMGWAVGEVDRLRAELAETRLRAERAEFHRDAQTNLSMALRDEGDLLAAVVESYNVNDDVRWADVLDAIGSWRSVRGDAPAPAEPPTQVEGAWLSKVIPAEPLAVELPVTLSSVDDVAAVCLAHGLTVRSSGPGWTQWRDPDTKAVVHCEAWQSGVERVTVAGRDRADIYRPVARGTLVAAIEAAWGGSR